MRHYREGEKLTYVMKGANEGRHYSLQADGIVKKEADGSFFEEFRWSDFVSDNQPVELSPATLNFREQLSLDPNRRPALPDLSKVDPRLIGPVTDLMTFYVDDWMAAKSGKLVNAGDHYYLKRGTPNSWADGSYILLGEDSIDFDFLLKNIDRTILMATLVVHHVPPETPEIKTPAEWMEKPVAGTRNNWVQIEKTQGGKFLGAAGKETFDVEIHLSLDDGRIISASMDNPLETVERVCDDVALTRCGDPQSHAIFRRIEISARR